MYMQKVCILTWKASVWRAIFPIFLSNNETSMFRVFLTLSWLLSSYTKEVRDDDMNMLLPFLESIKSKALRNWSFSCCSRVDQNAGGSMHAVFPNKEWTPQMAKTMFWVIRLLSASSMSGIFSWQQREVAIRNNLLGFIIKQLLKELWWFSLLTSVTRAKYKAVRRTDLLRIHECGCNSISHIASHISWNVCEKNYISVCLLRNVETEGWEPNKKHLK